jgi:hypothetical protein
VHDLGFLAIDNGETTSAVDLGNGIGCPTRNRELGASLQIIDQLFGGISWTEHALTLPLRIVSLAKLGNEGLAEVR